MSSYISFFPYVWELTFVNRTTENEMNNGLSGMLQHVLGNLSTSPGSIEFEPDLRSEISFIEQIISSKQIKL